MSEENKEVKFVPPTPPKMPVMHNMEDVIIGDDPIGLTNTEMVDYLKNQVFVNKEEE